MKAIFTLLFVVLCSVASAQNFSLPVLKYDLKSLDPVIDSVTMRIHYTKHHQAYINNLNKALLNESPKSIEEIIANISKYNTVVRNNAGGHYNHTMFWELLTPNTILPSESFLNLINKSFGSLDNLKKSINSAGVGLFGSGWVWLILNQNNELEITTTSNQDNPLMDIATQKGTPILCIDVWEHAYYLKYQNKRVDYLENIWKIVNWNKVEEKYQAALKK